MTRIRPMRAEDAAAVADLTTQLGYPVDAAELARRFDAVSARSDDAVLVATDADDRPIGWIHVGLLVGLAVSHAAGIHGLVVDEAERSAGVGAALVEAGEAWARDRGVSTITVRSRIARVRAHRFYARLGYREIKRSLVFEKALE
jgi:(aminoalkyl)phosphonate N-acetyltransferase